MATPIIKDADVRGMTALAAYLKCGVKFTYRGRGTKPTVRTVLVTAYGPDTFEGVDQSTVPPYGFRRFSYSKVASEAELVPWVEDA